MEQPDSEPSLGRDLVSSIFDALVDTENGKSQFLPEGQLRRLVNPESVARELSNKLPHTHTPEEVKKYTNAVCNETNDACGQPAATKSFRKIFTLLVMLDDVSSIPSFLDEGLSDLDLPLMLLKSHGKLTLHKQDPLGNQFPDNLGCFKNRPQFWLDSFERYQWMLLAPFFCFDNDGGPKHYVFKDQYILPFVPSDNLFEEADRSGAYGKVHMTHIHPEQHCFTNGVLPSRGFAVKQLFDNDEVAFANEVNMLKNFSGVRAHRHVNTLLATYEQFSKFYLIFYWANGDLHQYWSDQIPMFNYENVLWVAEQRAGIADGLSKLHEYRIPANKHSSTEDSRPYRREAVQIEQNGYHGDMNPGNVLWYDDSHEDDETLKGTLKLSGFGQGGLSTVLTSTARPDHGITLTYRPPEFDITPKSILPLDDIWGLGCLYLELVTWILGGRELLHVFLRRRLTVDIFEQNSKTDTFFQAVKVEGRTTKGVIVKPAVTQFINVLHRHSNCTEYFHEVLDLTQLDMLLLESGHRKSSREIRDILSIMYRNCCMNQDYAINKTPSWMSTVIPKLNIPHFIEEDGSYDVRSTVRELSRLGPLAPEPAPNPSSVSQTSLTWMCNRKHLSWEFPIDNRFAEKVISQIRSQAKMQMSFIEELCDRCTELDFAIGGVFFEETFSNLEKRAPLCRLCKLVFDGCKRDHMPEGQSISLKQIRSTLNRTECDSMPILSIVQSIVPEKPIPIQLGFPTLSKPGSETFFELLNLWLWDCDNNHRRCQDSRPKRLPTRLIDVGTLEDPILRLIETRKEEVLFSKYIALSHPWGDPKKHPPFSTLRKDPNGRGHDIHTFRKAISYSQLPCTFKDAVKCSRALGIRYLWIDSICIIQGPDGDFNEESKKMEDVFSGAYCVLAASRATGQLDGFLGDRPQRDCAEVSNNGIFVCEHIDNFRDDILEGRLNRRGWVLQERALAQRTIFFGEKQTYFACGNGVRCETLAMMTNNMASFLGDPKFPDKAMHTSDRTLQVSFYQDLYRRYTRLQFSRDDDRPFAISGLEKRLQRAFGTKGGYGIFDDGPNGGLFHQRLLWTRGEDEPHMMPITFPAERNVKVPSWSWMAYKGSIDYLDLPVHLADWETNDIMPPWTMRIGDEDENTSIRLTATVRGFTRSNESPDEVKLVHDAGRAAFDEHNLQCFIVAKSKEEKTDQDRRYFVIIVTGIRRTTASGKTPYKRIGAGYMPGKCISLNDVGTLGMIY